MDYSKMTVDQLNAILEDTGVEIIKLRQRAKQIMAARNKAIQDEQLDHWGLTAEQYAAAKAKSVAEKKPAHVTMNEARRAASKAAREAQTVKAQVAIAGIQAKGT